MRTYKFVKNFVDTADEATMLIYEAIGYDPETYEGIRGIDFANEMYYLRDYCNVKNVTVRINSMGGSVEDGQTIFAAIAFSGMNCTVYIDGIVASIAAIIALAGNKVFICNYGRMMFHDPFVEEKMSEKDRAALASIKGSLVTMVANRASLTEAEVSEMLARETWLEPDECLELKLVDGIFTPDNQPESVDAKTPMNKRFAVYNKFLNPEISMKKVYDRLKIQNNASEEAIIEAIEKIDTERTTALAEVDRLKVVNKTLTDEKAASDAETATKAENDRIAAETVATTEATAEVDAAVEAGKIVEADDAKLQEVKNQYIAIGKTNLVALKDILNRMPAKNKAADILGTGAAEGVQKWSVERINAENRAKAAAAKAKL